MTSTGTGAHDFRIWRICAWAGPVYAVGELVSWAGIARFLPPPRENWSADRVAGFYRDHEVAIRIGMEGVLIFALLYALWSLAIARVMRRAEGPEGLLSSIQLIGGIITALITMGCAVFWLTASFRAQTRAPDEIQSLNDTGWMVFDMTVMATLIQMVAFGVLWLLRDARGRATPLMPRWVSYASFWMAATFFSVFFMPSFATGPLSWQGIVTLYVALGAFFAWIGIVSVLLLRAIRRIEAEELGPAPAVSVDATPATRPSEPVAAL